MIKGFLRFLVTQTNFNGRRYDVIGKSHSYKPVRIFQKFFIGFTCQKGDDKSIFKKGFYIFNKLFSIGEVRISNDNIGRFDIEQINNIRGIRVRSDIGGNKNIFKPSFFFKILTEI